MLCEFAVKKLIPAGSSDPRITARLGIWHVDAGNAETLYDYFAHRSGGIESHFFIKKTGVLEQYRDTAYQADANLDANDFALSVETQGFGEGEWTDEQIAMSKRLMRWMHQHHGIPFQKAGAWDGKGFGYHTQWGAPSHWTPVSKTCPGPDRIVQFNKVLVPWLNDGGHAPARPAATPNITAALHADTPEERVAALKRVVRRGDDRSANIAAHWLEVIQRIENAKQAAHDLRVDLKEHEVKV